MIDFNASDSQLLIVVTKNFILKVAGFLDLPLLRLQCDRRSVSPSRCSHQALVVQSSTITLDQCSAKSSFDVSVLTLHRRVPFGVKQLSMLFWFTHFSEE